MISNIESREGQHYRQIKREGDGEKNKGPEKRPAESECFRTDRHDLQMKDSLSERNAPRPLSEREIKQDQWIEWRKAEWNTRLQDLRDAADHGQIDKTREE